jgi:iron(III) transport system substrate-binding protein
MLIGKKAANPNAAKLWVDYLLSRRGQTALAERAGLAPVRSDLASSNAVASLAKTLGARGRPIALGSELIDPFPTREARLAFVRQWQQAVGVRR